MFHSANVHMVQRARRPNALRTYFASSSIIPGKEPFRRGVLFSTVAGIMLIIGGLLTWMSFNDIFGARASMMGPLLIALSLGLTFFSLRQFLIARKQNHTAAQEGIRFRALGREAVAAMVINREDGIGAVTVIMDTVDMSSDASWRDLANGYLIAEIFNRYYPFEIEMTYFNKGSSLYAKQHNWQELSKFFKKKKFDISQACIDGTMFCKEIQSTQMIQSIYKILTDRKWPLNVTSPISDDLSDNEYQMHLPLHAQSTATKAVKNNIMFTELLVYPNQLLNARKAQKIIDRHMELRLKKRLDDPERFHVHPTLGQQSVRQQNLEGHKEDVERAPQKKAVTDSINDINVRFKDIKLKQPFITPLQ